MNFQWPFVRRDKYEFVVNHQKSWELMSHFMERKYHEALSRERVHEANIRAFEDKIIKLQLELSEREGQAVS